LLNNVYLNLFLFVFCLDKASTVDQLKKQDNAPSKKAFARLRNQTHPSTTKKSYHPLFYNANS